MTAHTIKYQDLANHHNWILIAVGPNGNGGFKKLLTGVVHSEDQDSSIALYKVKSGEKVVSEHISLIAAIDAYNDEGKAA